MVRYKTENVIVSDPWSKVHIKHLGDIRVSWKKRKFQKGILLSENVIPEIFATTENVLPFLYHKEGIFFFYIFVLMFQVGFYILELFIVKFEVYF